MHIISFILLIKYLLAIKIGKKNLQGKITNTYAVNCIVMHLTPPTNKSINYNNSPNYDFTTALLLSRKDGGEQSHQHRKKQIEVHITKKQKKPRFYQLHCNWSGFWRGVKICHPSASKEEDSNIPFNK